jgi:hypothetical protein
LPPEFESEPELGSGLVIDGWWMAGGCAEVAGAGGAGWPYLFLVDVQLSCLQRSCEGPFLILIHSCNAAHVELMTTAFYSEFGNLREQIQKAHAQIQARFEHDRG